jgi:hypothetical protein
MKTCSPELTVPKSQVDGLNPPGYIFRPPLP